MRKSQTSATPVLGEAFQHDPDFKGPVKERSCTDVLCLCLFLGFLAGWAVIAYFAFRFGNPSVLLYPTDSDGNICGMDKFESKPHLFFFDLTSCANPNVVFKGCKTPQVCVSKCPNETFFVPASSGDSIKSKLVCKNGVDVNSQSVSYLISNGDCANMYLESKPLVGRCLPIHLVVSKTGIVLDKNNNTMKTTSGTDLQVDVLQKAEAFLAQFLSAKEMGEKVYSDLHLSWRVVLVILVIVMLLAMFWIFLMRWIAGIMVWLSLICVFGLTVYGTYYSVMMYRELLNDPKSDAAYAFTTNLSSYLALRKTWLIFAIISGVLCVIFLFILVFLRKRLVIAIALIREASRAVGHVWSSLIFPLVPYVIQLLIFAFWLAVTLYTASTGKASYVVENTDENSIYKNGTLCNPKTFEDPTAKCVFHTYGDRQSLYKANIYNFIGLLWTVFFMIGVGQVSLAGAFAAYYWTLNKRRDLPTFPVIVGFWRCIRYHLGSVAFGSLIITIVRMIRYVLEGIDQYCKKYDNPFTRCIMCCLKCCFWALEKFLRFISRNAFIMMAVYGNNFCSSAKTAFELLLRNTVRTIVLENVTGFLLFIGKMVIVAFSAVLSFHVFSGHFTFMNVNEYVPKLNYPLLPVIIVIFGAYVIASLFFSVFAIAVDTLFLCFLEDCERNDGSQERPYFMSKELMKILNKKNQYVDPKS